MTQGWSVLMSPEEISDERAVIHCLLCKTHRHPVHPECPKERFLHRISPDDGSFKKQFLEEETTQDTETIGS